MNQIADRLSLWSLFLVLFALKQTGHYPYSWWIVTVPLWAPAALAVVAFVIAKLGGAK